MVDCYDGPIYVLSSEPLPRRDAAKVVTLVDLWRKKALAEENEELKRQVRRWRRQALIWFAIAAVFQALAAWGWWRV